MSKKYIVLYNPNAGNNTSEAQTKNLISLFPHGEFVFHDILKIHDYKDFFANIAPGDTIILAGGDGTLNRFVNNTDSILPDNEILFYATGSGNDFLNDLGLKKGEKPFSLKKYISKLPSCAINGKTFKFINGAGLGLDGDCCEKGNRKRNENSKPVNYTAIALKSVLFEYKPVAAEITVDGITKKYKKVWMVSAMNGRFCGGGMMMTPDQHRLSDKEELSVIVIHDISRLRILTIFSTIFTGKHVKYKKYIDIITGKNISVKFSSPVSAQIDGETQTGVSVFEAIARGAVNSAKETVLS